MLETRSGMPPAPSRKGIGAHNVEASKTRTEVCGFDDETDPSLEEDPLVYQAAFSVFDRSMHANLARYTNGLSPWALMSAQQDWLTGLAFSPGKQIQLLHKAIRKWTRLAAHARERLSPHNEYRPCILPLPQDHRFDAPEWQEPPYCFYYQSFLLLQQWWHNATTGIEGVSPENERIVQFTARQILDTFSPTNFVPTNPTVLEKTIRSGGQNLLDGYLNLLEDVQAGLSGHGPSDPNTFRIGRDLAATPGKVVYRNRLIELIQYTPATERVLPEPVLVVPAWIMKYYILDLEPDLSLVRHLLRSGRTVFMISWKNPGEEDRDLSFADYHRLGPVAALEEINRIVPGQPVHGAGYCLGGTLLAISASALAQTGSDPFCSLSFFATQVDFEEAGELMLFINEKQIAFLKDMMWQQGFLDSRQMAGTFQFLRSADLIWSRLVTEYLMGEHPATTALMAWNADGTRMPFRMHSDYLEHLFLKNEFAEGRYSLDGEGVSLTHLKAPLFVVGAERDHVAPWRSTYRFHEMTECEMTYVLASGGHNVGIVPDTHYPGIGYRIASRPPGAPDQTPERWLRTADRQNGSWWHAWTDWLDHHSSQKRVPPPPIGSGPDSILYDAPGTYVRMK